MKKAGFIFITDHAATRFRQLIPNSIHMPLETVRRIMVAMYYDGFVRGGGQKEGEYLIKTTHKISKQEVVFAICPDGDTRIVKTVLIPDHARANVEVVIPKSKARKSKAKYRRKQKEASENDETGFFEEEKPKKKKTSNKRKSSRKMLEEMEW